MILVIGATGKVGKELIPQLIDNGTRVRVLVRDAFHTNQIANVVSAAQAASVRRSPVV